MSFLASAVVPLNVYKFRRHSSPMPSRVPIQGRQRWSRCYLLRSRGRYQVYEIVLLSYNYRN